MFKAIIFDVDGTLAETEDVHRKAFNLAFKTKGLPWHWDSATYRQLLHISGGKERIRHFVERHDPDRVQAKNLDGWIPEIHRTKTALYTQMIADSAVILRPGIRQLIDDSVDNDIRLAIATTTSPPNIDALLQATLGTEGAWFFDEICDGDSVPNKKPAPDVYLLTLNLLNLKAEDCVAIEDSRNGLLSSSAAGIATIVTPGIYTDDQNFDEATIVTNNLNDVDFAELFFNTRKQKITGSRQKTA